MQTSVGPTMTVGLVLFFLGGIVCMVGFAQGSRLAMGFAGLQNFRAYLDNDASARRRMGVALAAAALGGLITCSSVMAGDATRNDVCAKACEESGLERGRYRASPHKKFEPGDQYDCWCRQGDDWAPESVVMPTAD